MRLRGALCSLLLCFAGVLTLSGCPRSNVPPPTFDGGFPPDGPRPNVDTDGDGLCDTNEVVRGLDPGNVDTDGDGYADLFEISNGFDGRAPASPPRDLIVLLEETPGATLRVPIQLLVVGEGESYQGAFQSLPQVVDDGRSAADYFGSQQATGADPMANVFAIEGDRVLGVLDRTALVFEVNFRWADPAPRGCMRGYPFLYTVKREDGRIVAQRRMVLVVTPRGQRPGVRARAPTNPCF